MNFVVVLWFVITENQSETRNWRSTGTNGRIDISGWWDRFSFGARRHLLRMKNGEIEERLRMKSKDRCWKKRRNPIYLFVENGDVKKRREEHRVQRLDEWTRFKWGFIFPSLLWKTCCYLFLLFIFSMNNNNIIFTKNMIIMRKKKTYSISL